MLFFALVYPSALELSDTQTVVSVGQFRPEKDHRLQLAAFARFLNLEKYQGCNHERVKVHLFPSFLHTVTYL